MHLQAQRTALAAISALILVACGGGSAGETGNEAATPASEDAAGSALTFTANDDITFAEATMTAAAGNISITVTCGAVVNHDVAIEGQNGDAPIAVCGAGETGEGTITLPVGTYTFFCSVPGHRGTMEGTLTVA